MFQHPRVACRTADRVDTWEEKNAYQCEKDTAARFTSGSGTVHFSAPRARKIGEKMHLRAADSRALGGLAVPS